jgi:hypothetical protein
MEIDGGCHCGQVSYRAEIDPDRVSICHCTDCQTLTGSPLFTTGEGADAAEWGIRWGSIRQRLQLTPKRQIWCSSALPWIGGLSALPGSQTD